MRRHAVLRRSCVRFCLLLLATALPLLAARSWAAPDDDDPFEAAKMFQVPDTVAARNALQEADHALARGETNAGLKALQRVLDEMPDDYARVPEAARAEALLWRSAAEIAAERLARLTPEQAAAYDHLVQPAAEPAMDAALAAGDLHALEGIARRFGASRYGARATRVLAELALEAGRGREAARLAAEGLRFAPGNAGLWRVRLQGLSIADDRAALERLELPANLGESRDALLELRQRALERLAGLRSYALPHGWGGDMARRGGGPALPAAVPPLRWTAPLPRADRSLDPTSFPGGRPEPTPDHFEWLLDAARPIVPVLDGRTAYVADGRSVRALDLSSGRPLWRYDHAKDPRLMRTDREPDGRTALDRAFAPVVAGPLLVATVEVPHEFYTEHLSGMPLSTYLPRRRAVAIDRASGNVVWMAGGDADAPTWLQEASVVAPVGVAEGVVVALVDQFLQMHNLSVVGFDLATGRVLWRCRLGYGARDQPVRQPAARAGGERDRRRRRLAYVATGLGLVASVDVLAGRVRWVASDVPLPIEPVITWYEAPLRRPSFGPSRVVVADDVIVVAPGDGHHVCAYERATGVLRWRTPVPDRLPRSTVAHLLGVVGHGADAKVIVTAGGVTALDLATGDVSWQGYTDPRPSDVIGEGVIAGDEVLVPTRQGLQRFSIAREGSFRGSAQWPDGVDPGNLVVGDDVFLVADRETVSGFYDWNRIAAQIERQRRERPDDPWLLVEAGDLYLRGGELDRAREMFQAGEDVAARSGGAAGEAAAEAARRGRVATWLHQGRLLEASGRNANAITAYEEAARLAIQAADRIEARLRLLELLPHGERRWRDQLEALVREDGDQEAWPDPDRTPVLIRPWARLELAEAAVQRGEAERAIDLWQLVLRDDPEADVLGLVAGRAAERRIDETLAQSGRAPYAKHEEAARRLLAEATTESDVDLVLARYPNSLAREDGLRRRAALRRQAGRLAEASDDFRTLGSTARDPSARAAALAQLVQLESQRGALGAARAARATLRRLYANTAFEVDGLRVTGATWAFDVPRPEVPEVVEPPIASPLHEVHHERAADELAAGRGHGRRRGVAAAAPGPGPPRRCARGAGPREGHAPLHGPGQRGDACGAHAGSRHPARRSRRDACRPGRRHRGHGVGARPGSRHAPRHRAWRRARDGPPRPQPGRRAAAPPCLRCHDGKRALDDAARPRRPGPLVADADHVWLRRTRYATTATYQDAVVLDIADGRVLHELPLPTFPFGEAWSDGKHLVAAGSSSRTQPPALVAYDLDSGASTWRLDLPGEAPTALATSPEGRLVVLTGEGRVREIDPATGAVVHETGIFVGENTAVRPFFGTPLLVQDDRLVLLPGLRSRGATLLAYARDTGKLVWEHPLTPEGFVGTAALGAAGDQIWAFVLRGARQDVSAELVVVDRVGSVSQRVDLSELAQGGRHPTVLQAYGAFLVVGRRDASILK
ncbi:MAG: PQQ-binding-like beta-propeller repeat protein [Planctomycetota bacterium]